MNEGQTENNCRRIYKTLSGSSFHVKKEDYSIIRIFDNTYRPTVNTKKVIGVGLYRNKQGPYA